MDMPRYVTKRRPNRKKEAQGGSTARYNPGQREDMENKANILQMAKNKKKKGANIFSLAMVDLSTSQAEVNVVIRPSPVLFRL